MDAEPFHRPVGPWDRSVGHGPHEHVGRFGREGGEVPKCVVCRLGLGDLTVGLGFRGMDQIGKLDPVLNEEDGDVVSDQIPVPLLRVEAHCKAADVAGGVGRAS